jgi:hypothetical protein
MHSTLEWGETPSSLPMGNIRLGSIVHSGRDSGDHRLCERKLQIGRNFRKVIDRVHIPEEQRSHRLEIRQANGKSYNHEPL